MTKKMFKEKAHYITAIITVILAGLSVAGHASTSPADRHVTAVQNPVIIFDDDVAAITAYMLREKCLFLPSSLCKICAAMKKKQLSVFSQA